MIDIIQTLTEYWPVSSSYHTKIWQTLTKTTVYTGSGALLHGMGILPLLLFFWSDLWKNKKDLHPQRIGKSLYAFLTYATLPLVIVTLLLSSKLNFSFSILYFSFIQVIFGACLLHAWKYCTRTKETFDIRDAWIVGIAQLCALIPGVSRLGVCASVLMWRGYTPYRAWFYAMMMAIPVNIGAFLWFFYKMSVLNIGFKNFLSMMGKSANISNIDILTMFLLILLCHTGLGYAMLWITHTILCWTDKVFLYWGLYRIILGIIVIGSIAMIA